MSKSDAGKGFWADSERRKVVARIIDKTGIEPQRVFQAEGYSEELGRSIGHYVPGPEALASSLEEAAMQYQFNAYWADKPSSSDLLAALNSIEKAASRILKVLNIGPQADDVLAEIHPRDLRFDLQGQAILMGERIGGYQNHPPADWQMGGGTYTDWGGKQQLCDVIIGIGQLRDWAQQAATRREARQRRRHTKTNTRGVAEKGLLQDLCAIWVHCFGLIPKLSRHPDTHKPTGPFMRFAAASFEEVEVPITDEAIATRIRRLMGKSGKIIMTQPISTE